MKDQGPMKTNQGQSSKSINQGLVIMKYPNLWTSCGAQCARIWHNHNSV